LTVHECYIPVHAGYILDHACYIPVHTGYILVHAGYIPVHAGYILVHAGYIPVHAGYIYNCHMLITSLLNIGAVIKKHIWLQYFLTRKTPK
jgi:hypothetical protein